MICKALHKKLNIEQQQTWGWTRPILCHMLNSKTKKKYNAKNLLWYKVWLATDTNIVEEILELKQYIRVYFYLRYRRKKKQQQSDTTGVRGISLTMISGKLILYPNGVQLVWLWFVMLYNCRLHNKVEDQYV